MTIADRIRNFWRTFKSAAAVAAGVYSTGPRATLPGLNVPASRLVTYYRTWVYVCISRIASDMSQTPLRLYARKTAGNAKRFRCATRKLSAHELRALRARESKQMLGSTDVEEVIEHPLLTLLANPNPLMNRFDFLESLSIYLDLTGNTYLLPSRNTLPDELWVLPSQWMTIEPDPKNFVKRYVFQPGMAPQYFTPEQIIHLKTASPLSLLYGYGPLQGALAAAELNENMLVYELSMMRNDGVAGTYITAEQMGDDERRRFLEAYRQRYTGPHNAGVPIMLGGKNVKIEKVSQTARDLQYDKGSERVKEQIAAAFGYPLTFLKGDHVPRANAETSIWQYAKFTLRPKHVRIEETLNERLVPLFDPERLFLAFDDVVPDDSAHRLMESESKLRTFARTINEDRAQDGYEPVPWGEEPLTPAGIPISKAASNAEAAANRPMDSGIGGPAGDDDDPRGERHILQRGIRSDVSQRWDAHDHANSNGKAVQGPQDAGDTPKERGFVSAIRSLLKEMQAAAIGAARRSLSDERSLDDAREKMGPVGLTLIDVRVWQGKWGVTAAPYVRRAFNHGGRAATARLRAAFDIQHPHARAALLRYTNAFASRAVAGIAGELSATVGKGIELGETVGEISTRIADFFGVQRGWPTERIARTETLRALNGGTVEGWQQSGQVEQKQWQAAVGDACPFCTAVDGKAVPLDEPFFRVGDVIGADERTYTVDYLDVDAPPLHPACRCSVIAILKEQDERGLNALDFDPFHWDDADVEALAW